MRKLAVAGLALPVLGFVYLSTFVRRSVLARAGALGLGVLLVVTGLVIGLPAKPIEAKGPTTFAPLSPSSFTVQVEKDLPLDAPVEILFSKPMNEESVASAIVLDPKINVSLTWSDDDQRVAVRGMPNWEPTQFYSLDIPGSVLGRDGQPLGKPVHTLWVTGSLTVGVLKPTIVTGDRVGSATSFQLTLGRPASLAAVAEAFEIEPNVQGSLTGDDPTDLHSQVFTFTPFDPLPADTVFTVSIAGSLVDGRGILVAPVTPLTVRTAKAPAVVRFRPLDKTTDVDPAQAVSVRFTASMDTTASTVAFVVSADGKPVSGSTYWAENDTVLVMTPKDKFAAGARVTMAVTTQAKSKDGVPLAAEATSSFTVEKPAPTPPKTPTPGTGIIPKPPTGGIAPIGSAPWYASEVYYMRLMNCTRTGGWVTSTGACSSATRHTLRAARALVLDAGISSRVSRPYAKKMADYGFLLHVDPYTGWGPAQRLRAAGYTNYAWGENIASPSSSGASGMIAVEIFYQNESPCRCEHYANIMDPDFVRAGVGVWVSNGRVRVAIDFYAP